METKKKKRVLIIGSNQQALIQAIWYVTNGYAVTVYSESLAKLKVQQKILINQDEKIKKLFDQYRHTIIFAYSKKVYQRKKEIIVICEDTIINGEYRVEKVLASIDEIKDNYFFDSTLILKCVLPFGLTNKINTFLKTNCLEEIRVIYSPLLEINTNKLLYPNNLFVGVDSEKSHQIISNIYFPYVFEGSNIVYTDYESIELSFYLYSMKLIIEEKINKSISQIIPEKHDDTIYLLNMFKKNELLGISFLIDENNNIYDLIDEIKKTIKRFA